MAAPGATRESVMKNALVLARESSKRFREHRELIHKFVAEFTSEAEADPKYGRNKYMARLQKATNGQLETIFIDLNDVESFCAQEIANPDATLLEKLSIPKLQLQQSTEKMIGDIEDNTLRYTKYFYNACDALKPERDVDAGVDGVTARDDLVMNWRDRKRQKEESAGQQLAPVPARLRNSFDIRFMPRLSRKPIKLREITAATVGSLVQLDCLVVRISQVKPKIEVVAYHCEVCDAEVFLSVEGEYYDPVKECPSERCKANKRAGKLRCNVRLCKFAKYQEMTVQEVAEQVPVGGVPRSISVAMGGDLTRKVLPGDAITLTGVFMPKELPWFQTRGMGAAQTMYIDANSIKKHKNGYNEAAVEEDDVLRRIAEEQARSGGSVYELAAKSLAPEIFGRLDEKKALLLALIGSYTKTMKDGMKIRGDIHTLFMGDPGVAKSQLLKQVSKIAPRSVYTTGKGTSGAGLTASVNRDPQTGEVTLLAGALVLADTGVCCIDEFDKMEEGDRTAIHEVMEQQSVSIAKAGITTSLNCRTTVLAAANPAYGRYNPYKSKEENVNLPPALLSRFDFLFLLLDTVEPAYDKKLAMHVCKAHGEPEDGDVLNLGFEPFDPNFMRTFIRKAKSFEPMIDDNLQRDMIDAYVTMREEEKGNAIDSRKSYTTPRTFLAILRISQAHARARFSSRVERMDFDEAMRLMKASRESVDQLGPVGKKPPNKLDSVYDVVADLSRQDAAKVADGWVDLSHVVSMSGHKRLTKDDVMDAIDNWESLGVMRRNERKTHVTFTVPVG